MGCCAFVVFHKCMEAYRKVKPPGGWRTCLGCLDIKRATLIGRSGRAGGEQERRIAEARPGGWSSSVRQQMKKHIRRSPLLESELGSAGSLSVLVTQKLSQAQLQLHFHPFSITASSALERAELQSGQGTSLSQFIIGRQTTICSVQISLPPLYVCEGSQSSSNVEGVELRQLDSEEQVQLPQVNPF